jgi:hypothetical protein
MIIGDESLLPSLHSGDEVGAWLDWGSRLRRIEGIDERERSL